MVYRVLYYLVNILIRVFYRKLYINGLENIDKSKTYLITSNHPNGFFEPLIMACTFPIDLNFMVRGDMFEKPFMNWFLRSTHQIPIFRFSDGFAKMKENQSSLMEATATLNQGGSIMLFAEGSTEALMRCRPIQKGTAKMAFQTFEEYPNKELVILPVGINFSNWRDPGNEVIVSIGESFDAKPYFLNNKDNKPKGTLKLTRDIELSMKKEIIHLTDKTQENYVRHLWALLNLKEKSYPRKTENDKLFQTLKNLSVILESGDLSYATEIEVLYDEILKVNGGKRPMGISSFWKILLIVPGLVGLFFHFIPVYIGYWMRNNKVKRDAFAAPVLGITSFISIIVLYILTFILSVVFIGFGKAILFLCALMVSGYCFLLFWENYHKVRLEKIPVKIMDDLDSLILKINRKC